VYSQVLAGRGANADLQLQGMSGAKGSKIRSGGNRENRSQTKAEMGLAGHVVFCGGYY